MKPSELVTLIKQANPKLLEDIPEKKVAQIIRLALVQIAQQVDATNTGVIKVPSLGNFRIQHIEREKEGQKTSLKRILFKVAQREAQ